MKRISIERSRVVSIAVGLAAFALSMFLGNTVELRAQSQSPAVASTTLPKTPVKAFTIYQRQTDYGSKGNAAASYEIVIGRKSNGSYVHRYDADSPDGEWGIAVEIFDVESLSSVHLSPFTRTKSTYYKTEAEMANLVNNLASCEGRQEVLPPPDPTKGESANMLGFRVVPVTVKQAGTVLASWIAPDLDCFPLMETYTVPGSTRSETVVTRVDRGEPAESLFAVPPDFVEVSPAQLEALHGAKYPGHAFWGDLVQRMNDQYFKGRKK